MPEICTALLVYEGCGGTYRNPRDGGGFSRPDVRCIVCDLRRALSRAVRAAAAARAIRARHSPEALHDAVTEKTAAIILEPIQGEGGVRPLTQEFANAVNEVCRRTGRSSDRRRSAVRARPDRPCVLLPETRHDSRSRIGREGACRRRPDGGGSGEGRGCRVPFVRRSRHHIRRKPARVSGGPCLPRRAQCGV